MISRPSVEFVPARPKYKPFAARAQRHCLQAEFGCAIFVFGERLRIDHGQTQLALRALRHLLQQFAHALRVGANRRRLAARFLREEEIQIHRFLQRSQDALRARRDRIELAFGQIDARAAQHESDQHGDADE